jgi:HPt (histidine-containing phosphotransfer) domain-containing protein
MSLNTLRVLLVQADPRQSQFISSALASANHMVLPARGLEEASEALSSQKFDAVVLGSPLPAEGITEFTGKLRALEGNQRSASRTAILSVSSELSDSFAWQPSEKPGIDGVLSERFEAETLVTAVACLASVICASKKPNGNQTPANLPVFDSEKFKAQVAYDRELLVEIIDLFLSEQLNQVAEMQEALAAGAFDRLYLTAHTIKGSLASLHAGAARLRAEELETATKVRNAEQCDELISSLKRDLERLEPALLELRNNPTS